MHYVDEGAGQPVMCVHGNPDWSFSYRHVIAGLREQCRVIACDHLGFGLSDKPAEFDYSVKSHAANFADFATHLDLRDVLLVVNDWGGPIALPWALDHPERVAGLVLCNTYLWSARGDLLFEAFSAAMGGPIGRLLIRRANLFAGLLHPMMLAQRDSRRWSVRRHVAGITPPGWQRKGQRVFPTEIVRSGPWQNEYWARIGTLAEIPATIVWGAKDPIFRQKECRRWLSGLPNSTLVKVDDAAHYPHEDRPDVVVAATRERLPRRQRP
ncbi:alpha/beta fold hydrolase [Nocardia colli]|uniref:Alpha/beta fold hydrolase n=1 Tax=Nocardia colli TaxID=2545717 RepID=A0A5N0DYK1_9NOCA|nr:alpha/beta fold hydrolase [Nocardia colli]KAA8880621.1 alpha/beta fold hydrolase [Nocardia colli]